MDGRGPVAGRQSGLFELEDALRLRGRERIAGVDEAGRGPLAGPVVAAAVIMAAGSAIEGVTDSKLLTADRREELFPKILAEALAVGIGAASPRTIDRMNILRASLLAMRRAVLRLDVPPGYCLVDGKFTIPALPFSQEAVVDGDALCYSVAAASIVAKVTRDRLMINLHARYPDYGFDSNKGYATRYHSEALRRCGPCPLHRLSFHPIAPRQEEYPVGRRRGAEKEATGQRKLLP